ncbi:rhomboid family intramembrane serine protease [Streptococcus sp. H31]|uniref:rhomboid family intramembrane serine protease n=1 Tax=Streptococcus huangxiaojuni TaxID=3237239 RepID=UPI0034A22E06
MKEEFKRNPVTLFLLSLTCLLFVLMQLLYFGQATSVQAVITFGGLYGEILKIFPSQAWRLITPIFVHIGWEHFIFNALSLYFIGRIAEQIWGSGRFLLLYILAGLSGNIFVFFFEPSVVEAGASTSLFGLFAAVAIIGYFGANPMLRQLGRSYVVLIVLNLVFNLITPGISLSGHLGGLIGGALCAVFLPTLYEANAFSRTQRLSALLVYLVLMVVMLFAAFSQG